jgi:hypothetical protein
MIIVKLIQILHMILILFICSSLVINHTRMKEISLTILIFIFFQYITNYGKCGLTQMEYLIMGENYQEGFLYRLINPIIQVPENYFDKYLFKVHILFIIILSYQLYMK